METIRVYPLVEEHLRLVDPLLGPVVDGVGIGLHPALRLHLPYTQSLSQSVGG